MIRLWREEVQLREATWQELGPLGEVSAGDPAERELEEQTPDLSFLHLSYLLPVPPTRWIQPKPEGKEAHWGRSAFWNIEQRESRPGEANGTYLTTNLFPIMYTNVDCFIQEKWQLWTHNTDSWFQITVWVWSENFNDRWTKNSHRCHQCDISIFIRSLLCARHCSKYFLYINSFSFHNSCLTCILKLVPDYNWRNWHVGSLRYLATVSARMWRGACNPGTPCAPAPRCLSLSSQST